jgi:hypothetical protein
VAVGGTVGGDTESGTPKAISDVRAVPPDVISLSEDTKSLIGIKDGRIFERHIPRHGDDDQSPAVGGENAVQLEHRPSVIGDVLEDMAADDDIERLVGELDVGHIQSQVDVISFEIRGVIAGTQTLAKARLETPLRCEVQDILGAAIEKIGVVVQQKPNKPMALQRSTVDALGFGTGRIPVGTEASG